MQAYRTPYGRFADKNDFYNSAVASLNAQQVLVVFKFEMLQVRLDSIIII